MSDVQARTSESEPKPATAVAVGAQPAGWTDAGAGHDQGSFGRALAAAREARSMSLADAAAQLRLHVRQVQAIEAEDLSALPEAPFVRGYVRNYAKLVDLPPEPLLALVNARLKPGDPLRSPLSATAVSPLQRTPKEPISGRVVVGGVVVVLGILALVGWWTVRDGTSPPPPSPVAAPSRAPAPEAPAAAAPATTPAVSAEEGGQAAEAPPVGETPAAAAAPDSTALRLTFRDRSWVEVRQADGTVLVSQNNAAGTTRVIEGKPPYLLVIGNASKVTLEYGGRTVDLAPSIGRDDVARLRLE
jgi:cytoskeleton protein RodZ